MKTLFALSGNTCAFADPLTGVGCEEKITNPEWTRVKARVCHIRGLNPTSARYDPHMTEAERASFDNLILLCPNHHCLVDELRPEDFPPDVLTAMKERGLEAAVHVEEWASAQELWRYTRLLLGDAFSDDADVAAAAVQNAPSAQTSLSRNAGSPDDRASEGDRPSESDRPEEGGGTSGRAPRALRTVLRLLPGRSTSHDSFPPPAKSTPRPPARPRKSDTRWMDHFADFDEGNRNLDAD